MADVLLVTCAGLPDGEPRGDLLVDAFAARGTTARWVAWDDAEVDWAGAGAVCLRSTWDYDARYDEFLAWARRIEAAGAHLLNGAGLFAWNTDKAYLPELAAAGVPVVPTIVVDGEEELPPAIAEFFTAVVKPRTAAGGRGVVVFDMADGGPGDLDESQLSPGPWVVQPLVESIHDEGEWSVFVLGGEVVSASRKVPAAGDIRVHEEYGGSMVAATPSAEHREVAERAVRAAQRLCGVELPYARVDQMRLADGTWAVSELEVTEPSLYLDVLPDNAGRFADTVLAHLGRP
ncbi:hypothetical protein [Nocardioides sp. AE5]|uniref:ATP-grasp domain-containing protein n=1 Tax=Nocardioides sp. AE5 TaxID=2962573 RepID=UPI002881EDBF|nr:hypothetical protein [Nocardioides sp. AE5]MDT0203731.1 hypothetical protein [Nocardioides sp. AE5]